MTGYYAATFDVFNQNDFIKGVGGDVVVTRTYTLLGKPVAPSRARRAAPSTACRSSRARACASTSR